MFSTIHEVEAFFNQRKTLGIKPGLERMNELLSRLDHPEKKMKAIHVAGTNGKGSTIHFLNAALRANHYETGVFTSPSFTGLTGHILLNDKAITESDFIQILNRVHPHVQQMDEGDMAPTEFEVLTAIAFVYFSENGEVTLVETGMGGRFDTTNTFNPILSIITNIAIDHTAYLGETLTEIASHKAGIIKEHAPVIIGEMEEVALEVMADEAKDKETDIHYFGRDFRYEKDRNSKQMKWKSKEKEYTIELSMQGEHQLKNASVVLKALEKLENMGYKLDWDKVIDAISKTTAPGRYELIHTNPIVIADAAHNHAGIKAFIDTVHQDYPDCEIHVVVAMFRDKETKEMLDLLSEEFHSITLTSFDHPRAASAKELYNQTDSNEKYFNENWKVILDKMMLEDKIYFITGSLHFMTLVRNVFRGEM